MSDRSFTTQEYLERLQATQAAQPDMDTIPARPTDKTNLLPKELKPNQEEIILEWLAPSRPFKKRQRRFYSTIAMIVILISLILFFAGQFLPIAVVISVAFLAYILSSVPPETTRHQISTFGLRIDGELFEWEEMTRFWFSQKYQQDLFYVEINRFPFRVTVLLAKTPAEYIRETLGEVILEQEPIPTFYDRASQWLEKYIPLETEADTQPVSPPTQTTTPTQAPSQPPISS
jgi:hypothetical protein